MPAVYDKEKQDSLEDSFNKPSITDEDRNTRRASSPASSSEIDSLNDSFSKPAIADEDRNTNKPNSREESVLNDDDGENLYKPSVSGISNRRKGIIGGIVGIFMAGTTFMGFVQLPNLIINHLREVLLGKLSSVQIDGSRRYRRSKYTRMKDMFSKNGRKAGAIANELEKSGYDFKIDKKTGKLLGITPPGSKTSLLGEAAAEHIEDYLEIKHPLRSARWKTKRMDSFYEYYKIPRDSPVPKTNKILKDPDVEMNKLIAGEVIDKEPKIKVKAAPESDNKATELKNNENKVLAEGEGSLDELRDKILKGTPEEKLLPEERNLLKLGDDTIDDTVMETVENVAKNGALGGKVLNSVKSFGNTADVLDKVCTIKNRLTAATLAARIFRARSLLKYASVFIKASDATRTGNVDPTLMNSLMKRVTATDRNGNTIGASPGFAYALKNKFNKNKNNAFKGSFGVDGKLTGNMGQVQNVTNKIPAMSENQCGTYQNPAFQIGVSGVDLAVTAFSGGTSKAATTAGKKTVQEVFEKILTKEILKKVGKQAVKQIAIEVSFEGAMTLMQLYVEQKLSIPFTGQEKGGQLGDILVGGAGVLGKQRALKAGLVPATKKQYVQAQNEYYAAKREENKKKNFFARNFDYNNYDSLTFNAVSILLNVPQSPERVVSSLASTLTSFSNSLFKMPQYALVSISQGFTGTLYAEATDEVSIETIKLNGEELATDPAGNLLTIMRSDILNMDTDENTEYLLGSGEIDENYEPKSDQFKEHIANCVESVDSISVIERKNPKDPKDPKYDCLAYRTITQRYKAHLAYLDMVDSISPASTSAEVVVDTPPINQVAPTKGVDTSTQQCSIGKDLGIKNSPVNGIKLRICELNGIDFNVAVEKNVKALLDSGSASGFDFSGSGGFRSYEEQISLRRSHCGSSNYDIYEKPSSSCKPPTARPGNSMHEWGLALDLKTKKGTVSSGSEVFNWLKNNKNTHGLINLPSEPWHWSTTGN